MYAYHGTGSMVWYAPQWTTEYLMWCSMEDRVSHRVYPIGCPKGYKGEPYKRSNQTARLMVSR